MLKHKTKLALILISLFSITSKIKACTDIEKYGLNNSLSDLPKKSMITVLYESPQSVMMDEKEKIKILSEIAYDNKDCFTFGTKEDNETSFNKWILYSRSLYALTLLGVGNYKETLLEEFAARRDRLETVDCYTDSKSYPIYLVGVWNQVASFDLKERNYLIEAAESGKIIPKDENIVKYWKNYNFNFSGI